MVVEARLGCMAHLRVRHTAMIIMAVGAYHEPVAPRSPSIIVRSTTTALRANADRFTLSIASHSGPWCNVNSSITRLTIPNCRVEPSQVVIRIQNVRAPILKMIDHPANMPLENWGGRAAASLGAPSSVGGARRDWAHWAGNAGAGFTQPMPARERCPDIIIMLELVVAGRTHSPERGCRITGLRVHRVIDSTTAELK